ncbi:MAG: methyltransferase domain-containing protein [Ginsengibacter sp.]
MSDYKKRSIQKELLDEDGIPSAEIVLNMKELEWINAHLGGHSITIKGFKSLLQNKKNISVCEIGCGGGDNLKVIGQFCTTNSIRAQFLGIDINDNCIKYARRNARLQNARFFVSDYNKFNFEDNKPDVIFSSLFCHHFSEEELVTMLRWMEANSLRGFFINDLHRHPIAYYFIKLATKVFSKSRLVKNDAPVSVLRGFKKKEWKDLLQKAGISNYSIRWKWAFRFLIVVPPS